MARCFRAQITGSRTRTTTSTRMICVKPWPIGYTISLPVVPDIAPVDPTIHRDQSRRSQAIGVRQTQILLSSLCLPALEMRRKNLLRLEWRRPFDVGLAETKSPPRKILPRSRNRLATPGMHRPDLPSLSCVHALNPPAEVR